MFKQKLILIMKKKDLSIRKLSRISGVAASTIASYINYDNEPTFEKVVKIADALNISLDEFR